MSTFSNPLKTRLAAGDVVAARSVRRCRMPEAKADGRRERMCGSSLVGFVAQWV